MSELCNYRAYVSLYCSLTNKKLKCYMLCTICPSVRAAQWRVQIPEILKAGQTAEAHTELCAFLRERRLIEKTGPPPPLNPQWPECYGTSHHSPSYVRGCKFAKRLQSVCPELKRLFAPDS